VRRAVAACGPVTVLPEKTRIAFQVRMSFAQVSPHRHWLDGHVVLARRLAVGSGRSFDKPGFLRKLDGIKGYIVTDIEAFPSVPYWMLKRESPRVQHKDSRERMISLIKSLPDVSPTESRV